MRWVLMFFGVFLGALILFGAAMGREFPRRLRRWHGPGSAPPRALRRYPRAMRAIRSRLDSERRFKQISRDTRV